MKRYKKVKPQPMSEQAKATIMDKLAQELEGLNDKQAEILTAWASGAASMMKYQAGLSADRGA